jgi:hypothetical protein
MIIVKENIMKHCLHIAVILILLLVPLYASRSYSGFLDNILQNMKILPEGQLDDNTIISGLKEALLVSTKNAVTKVSDIDGYLGNEAIKILLPEKMKTVADVLGKIGKQDLVDEFVTSMNRAAEKAAPKAVPHFTTAIKEMSIEDAKKILDGGDTAATDYFKSKTHDNLYDEFKPIISSTMDEVGVTSTYKEMMGKYESVPFVTSVAPDLDHHVTEKALDGLFFTVGEEEKKIRTDPAARVTDLLKKVFES